MFHSMLVAFCAVPLLCFSQGTLRRPQASNTDVFGQRKDDAENASKGNRRLHGNVVMDDGTVPDVMVQIIASCPGFSRLMGTSDSRGRFEFSFDSSFSSDLTLTSKGCVLYALLPGYETATLSLTGVQESNLGTLTLKPRAGNSAGLRPASNHSGTEHDRKIYDRAVGEASKQDFTSAVKRLQQLVSSSPQYSAAWLGLGLCEEIQGARADAVKSYLQAAQADPKFALPLVYAASIEKARGDYKAALEHSQDAIDLNPLAFPDAYAIRASASLLLGNADEAEKSARAGLALDRHHRYPELEYILATALFTKNDVAEAKQHFRTYVSDSPNGPNVSSAREQLAAIEQTETKATKAGLEGAPMPQGNVQPPSTQPRNTELASFQAVNAPLLANSSDYTCLESILPQTVDSRGHSTFGEVLRADVGVSEGKEIYGPANGKRFEGRGGGALLGYQFSTTGLFGSIARALVAGTHFTTQPSGNVTVGTGALTRFDFHGAYGGSWTIVEGSRSGVAGEQGWFLFDSKTHLLRRVFIAAAGIPQNLKLSRLSALVDYEPEVIEGRSVLVPSSAKVEAVDQSGVSSLAFLSFDHCRAFTAESTLRTDAETPDLPSSEGGIRNGLSDGTELEIVLRTAVTPSSAASGSTVQATVLLPIKKGGQTLLEAGAQVEGDVRMEWNSNTLILELSRIQTHHGWAPFYAKLVKFESAGAYQVQSDPSARPEVPGLARMMFTPGAAAINPGTQMLWKTEPLLNSPIRSADPKLGTSVSLR